MKRILLSGAVLLAVGVFLVLSTGASSGGGDPTYNIEFQNAFGLVTGADFRVAGVNAGTIQSINLCYTQKSAHCTNPLDAVVQVQVSQSGFGQFRSDAFCQSRPQSLIGEYFIECQPGSTGSVLPAGGTIPVKNTFSTIPGDLLQNVMRMPYRERFTLIINELGAAVAARSTDISTALARAVPALNETDNLLNLLANDSHTLQALTASSNTVITALANNSKQVQRFIVEANNTATDTATQSTNLQATWQKFPGFLEQLRPALQKLGNAATTNTPVLQNLNQASGLLDRFFTDLPAFSRSSIPALKSLGKASVTGKTAVQAAAPTIKDLNAFAKPTPELAQNLSIVLHDLDDRSRAVEADSRSPGGKGYTGLEALLQYVFNQTLAINGFGPFGHFLTVDAFVDPRCAPYTTPNTGGNSITSDLVKYGPTYRQCYAWLGPNQPGINERDPSDPSACVPDPGGSPPGEHGPAPSTYAGVTKCTSSPGSASKKARAHSRSGSRTSASGASPPTSKLPATKSSPLQSTLGQIQSLLGGGSSQSNITEPTGAGQGTQAQQLLNYLLAP